MKNLGYPGFIIRNKAQLHLYLVMVTIFCICLTKCINRSETKSDPELKVNSAELKSAVAEIQIDYLRSTLEQATKEQKNVFLIFGSPSCASCRRLEKVLQDSSVYRIINKYFIVNTFDVIRTTKGKELYKIYWKMGMPSWTILDKERNIIVDSSYPSTGSNNIGYPHNEKDLAHFAQAIKLGAPAISKSEIKILTDKIIYYSPNKDQY